MGPDQKREEEEPPGHPACPQALHKRADPVNYFVSLSGCILCVGWMGLGLGYWTFQFGEGLPGSVSHARM